MMQKRENPGLNRKKIVLIFQISTNFHTYYSGLFSTKRIPAQYFMDLPVGAEACDLADDWLKLFTRVTGDLCGWMIPKSPAEPRLAH